MEAMPGLQQRPVEVDVDDGADAVLPDADLVVGDADHRVRGDRWLTLSWRPPPEAPCTPR